MASGLFGSLGGSTLGEVLVRVGVDTKPLQAGLAKAEGEAKAAGKSVGTFGTLAKAGFAVAATAAVAFVASSVKSYEEHERVLAQLQLQIKGSTAALEDQATALQNLTGFQDEEVLSADTVLSRFKLTQSELRSTIPLVLDFARAQGQDVTTSAEQVGKALLGNTRALKAIGVTYTMTGNRALDLANIQDILREKVGGAAAAFGQTFAGQVAILAAQFDDLKEKVGAAVVPLLQQLIPVLQDLVQGFSDGIDIVQGLADRFPVLGTALKATFLPLQLLLDGIHELDSRLNGVQTTATLAEGGLHGLRQGAKDAGVEFRTFGGLVGDALDKFRKDTIKSFIGFAGSIGDLGKRWTITADQAVHSMQRMAQMQRTLAGDLKELDKAKIGSELKKFLLEQGPQAIHAFIDGTRKQRGDFKKAFDTYRDAAKETTDGIKKVTSTGGKAAGKALGEGTAIGITGSTQVAVSAATNLGFNVVAALKAALLIASPSKKTIEIGHQIVDGLVEGLKDREKYLESAFRKVSKHLDKLQDRLRSFRDSIRNGFAGLQDLGGLVSGLFGQTDAEGNPVAVNAADISTSVQSQVAQAQQLADALQAAMEAGLSQDLLAQFAGQGAAAIPALNELLENPELIGQLNSANDAIAKAAGSTAHLLGEEFFGKAIAKAQAHLERLSERIKDFIDKLRSATGDLLDALRPLIQALGGTLREGQGNLKAPGARHFGGGGGGANHQPVLEPGQSPPIIVHIAAGLHEEQWIDVLHGQFIKKQRRNGSLGFV